MKGHWYVYGPAEFTGTAHGVEFENGFAYVNWKTLGEDETRVVLDRIGQDPRFRIVEILEQDSPYGSKAPDSLNVEPAQEVQRKQARKGRK